MHLVELVHVALQDNSLPLLGRRATYDDMRYAERFVLDTVDVLKTWNVIMEKRKQQEEKQAQHFDL